MLTKHTETPPVEVFYSYAPPDEEMRDTLEHHLAGLKRQGLITAWHEGKIGPGEDMRRITQERLATARVVLLLVSADFLASDACYEEQLTSAVERHARGEARVIPVILRDCDWAIDPLDRLMPLPKDGRPVASWASRDEAFADVARGIRKAVEAVRVHHVEACAVEAHKKQTGKPPSNEDRREIRTISRHLGPFIAGSRVLWVDDYPDNNISERRALAELQVEVDTCVGTEEALEALIAGTRYALVLSDWSRAPQKRVGLSEGLRLLRAMRKASILTPLIFYTGLHGSETLKARRSKATAAGATGLTASPRELLRWSIAELVRSAALDPESAFAALPLR
jgi:CheY-like chemotaxis protein